MNFLEIIVPLNGSRFFFQLTLKSFDHAELGLSSTDNAVDFGMFRQSIGNILLSAKLLLYTIKNELFKR